MAKRTLCPLYAEADAASVKPVLEALKEKGFAIAPEGKAPGKNGVVLFFLSNHITEASQQVDDLLRYDAQKPDVIPINLDGAAPPKLIENTILARNTIFSERYSTHELAERIADALKKPSRVLDKLRVWIVVAAAVALLAVIGIVLFRIFGCGGKEDPGAGGTPAPTAAPTEVPYIDPQANIKPEELEKVHELIILGDRLCISYGDEEWVARLGYARIGAEHYANRVENETGIHWYSNEDGHEIEMGHWNDLSFLKYMKNLLLLTIVRVDGELPDLSGLEKLNLVEIFDCSIDDITNVGGSRISCFGYRGDSVTDFSPLNKCKRLRDVHLEFEMPMPQDLSSLAPPAMRNLHVWGDRSGAAVNLDGLKQCTQLETISLQGIGNRDLAFLSDSKNLTDIELYLGQLENLNGLQNKQKLTYLRIGYECDSLRDCSALSDNTSLVEVDLHCERMDGDLSWLSNDTSLEELQLWNTRNVRSLRGLENHSNLNHLLIRGAEQLTDVSALGSCAGLMEVQLMQTFALSDVSAIAQLPNLTKLEIYGSQLDDVDFLYDIQKKDCFSFGIAEVRDWSGLQAISKYAYLNVTDRNGSCLPYLAGKTVWRFELWNRGGMNNWNRNPIDYSQFPNVTDELILHGVRSLEGLPAFTAYRVQIDNSDYLTSLNGLQNLPSFTEKNRGDLYIQGCPRLSDWSALDGMTLAKIELIGTFSFPEFKNLQAKEIRIESPFGLNDLHCFDGYQPDVYCSVELLETNDVQDLSPLYGIRTGDALSVPAHLGEQAQLLVDSGNFKTCSVIYPDGGWAPAEVHVSLLSLDEIETLPSAVLAQVDRLCMAGDTLYDPEQYWVDEQRDDAGVTLYLCENGSDSREPIETGTILTDLSVLQGLTGLKDLSLHAQPLTNLEGIQYLDSLETLKVQVCPTLADASAALTLQQLRTLDLHGTSISSIDGVQYLYNLEWLNIEDTEVTDFSPLGACSDALDVAFKLPLMTYADFCSLPSDIRNKLNRIQISGTYVHDPWGDWTEDWEGDRMYLQNWKTGERIRITEGALTDLTELPEMQKLERIRVYLQPQLTSLQGIEAFEDLIQFSVRQCRALTSLEPVFAVQSLEALCVNDCGVTSIDGVQNLKHLQDLDIGNCPITDLSPLAGIDYTDCMRQRDDGRIPYFSLRIDGLGQTLPKEQYAYLASVPTYNILNVWNTDISLWLEAVQNTPIMCLQAGDCNIQNDTLKAFAEQHPEVREMIIPWNPRRLTDLTPLLGLKNLKFVRISNDLDAAIRSLGEDLHFRLEIE